MCAIAFESHGQGQTNPRVLVTGATGFVGSVLCEALAQSGVRVRAALRTMRPMPASIAELTEVGDIGRARSWIHGRVVLCSGFQTVYSQEPKPIRASCTVSTKVRSAPGDGRIVSSSKHQMNTRELANDWRIRAELPVSNRPRDRPQGTV